MDRLRSSLARVLLAIVAGGVLLAPACAASAAAQAPARAVLTRADFVYQGTTPLPLLVDGVSTLYTVSGLALRRVGPELRAFVGVNGQVMEFAVSAPGAPLVLRRNHGVIWRAWDGEPQALTAMHFRQTAPDGSGQLWFAHAYFYHVTGGNDPHVSVATFEGEAYTGSLGPFATAAPYNKTRSGITSWPDGRLLFGAGGHFAGVSTASLGLFAGAVPPLPGPLLPVEILVDHPYRSQDWATSQRRLGDYSSRGLPTSPDDGRWPQPEGTTEPRGRWQYYDGLDTFAFIDAGTKWGLVAVGELATETITYDAGGTCTGCRFRVTWHVFDPAQVAANGGRPLEPTATWRVGPGEMGDPHYGRVLTQHKDGQNLPLGTGLAYDPTSGFVVALYSKLALLAPGSPDWERLGGLMFFQVGKGAPSASPAPLPTAITQCSVVLRAEPPDRTSGWTAQFFRGEAKVGTADSAAPFERSATFPAGAHTFTVRWTKPGQPAATSAPIPWSCQ